MSKPRYYCVEAGTMERLTAIVMALPYRDVYETVNALQLGGASSGPFEGELPKLPSAGVAQGAPDPGQSDTKEAAT